MGELQEDFSRIWEDLAGLRQEVGWIRQPRADFGRIVEGFGQISGELQEDFYKIWEDLA